MPNQNNATQMAETTCARRPTALVLGGTGRTGALVAQGLSERGLRARTAARSGADVRFDWDDVTTYSPALIDVDRVYLVTIASVCDCGGVRLGESGRGRPRLA